MIAQLRKPLYLISRLLVLKRKEAANFSALFALLFISNLGLTLGRSSRDTLFLLEVGPGWIPVMYIACTIFLVVASLVYNSLIRKFHPRQYIAITYISLSIALIAAWAMVTLQVPGGVITLYITTQIVWVISIVQFWNLAIEIIDAQLAKRLFPYIGAGGLCGMMLTAPLCIYLTKIIGSTHLTLIWCALLLTSIPLSRFLIVSNNLGRKVVEKGSSNKGVTNEVKRSKYLQLFALSTILMWIVVYLVDYLFLQQVNQRFDNRDEMTNFFLLFHSSAGAFALLVHVSVTPRLLKDLGVAKSSVFFPSFLLGSLVLYLIFDNFWIAVLIKLIDSIFFYSVHEAVYQLLYNPISDQIKATVRSFIEGIVKPGAIALAGAALLFFVSIKATFLLPWLAALICAMWLVSTHWHKISYAKTLLEILHTGGRVTQAHALEALKMTKDSSLYQMLLDESKNPDARRALTALDLYESIGGPVEFENLKELLNHPHPAMRARIIKRTAEELQNINLLHSHVADDGEEACVEAMAQAAILDPLPKEKLEFLAKDQRPLVNMEANLQLSCYHQNGADVQEEINQLLESSNTQQKSYLLKRIGELDLMGFQDEVERCLMSDEREIYMAAIELASHTPYINILPKVFNLLHNPIKAEGAEMILISHDRKAFEMMSDNIDPTWPQQLLTRWPRLMIQTGKAAGRMKLINSLIQHCPRIRKYQIQALVDSERVIALSGPDLEALSFIFKRLATASFRMPHQRKVLEREYHEHPAWSFLEEILDSRFKDLRTCCLLLMGLIHRKGVECQLLETKLSHANPRIRAQAIETLENVMGKNIQLVDVQNLYKESLSVDPKNSERRQPGRILKEIATGGLPWEQWVVSQIDETRLSGIKVNKMINLDHFFFLQSVSIFNGMKKEDLYSISELTHEAEFSPGEEIFHEGDDGNSLFIIMEGKVDIIVSTDSGPKIVAQLGEKQCFGDMALLDEEKRSATVSAVTPLKCLILEKSDFQHLLDQRPTLSQQIISFLVLRLREANKN